MALLAHLTAIKWTYADCDWIHFFPEGLQTCLVIAGSVFWFVLVVLQKRCTALLSSAHKPSGWVQVEESWIYLVPVRTETKGTYRYKLTC